MKDEANGRILVEFCGLRAKMYAYSTQQNYGVITEEMKAKGVKKGVVKKSLCLKRYLECLYDNKIFYRTMRTIRSFNQELYTTCLNKVALCSRDDKRYNLPHDVSSTLAYGHRDIPKIEAEAAAEAANIDYE